MKNLSVSVSANVMSHGRASPKTYIGHKRLKAHILLQSAGTGKHAPESFACLHTRYVFGSCEILACTCVAGVSLSIFLCADCEHSTYDLFHACLGSNIVRARARGLGPPSMPRMDLRALYTRYFVTSPSARPSFRKYMTTPLPPFWASLTASSTPKIRYGRHVQMSDPKTSLPLPTRSC